MIIHFFILVLMQTNSLLWPAALLVLSLTSHVSLGQTAADSISSRRLQLRAGLNAGRFFRSLGYYGGRLPLSVGAEYSLRPNLSLYAQADAELGVPRLTSYFGERLPLVPTGALSLGARYYYNQAGRRQNGRAHGAFVGNYLALEAHTEMQQRFLLREVSPAFPSGKYELLTNYSPSLNLLWGMQRRLGRSFLFDLNAGIGLSPKRSDAHFGGYSSGVFNASTQINLGIYFGR
jgi:hypothetical protein